MRRGRAGRALALLACAAVSLASGAGAWAQTDHDVDRASVAVMPVEVDLDAPNGGTWFVLELLPGESASAEARIVNPRTTPVTAALSLRALDFGDGVTVDEDPTAPVASWGGFAEPEVVVPARGERRATFEVHVPVGTAPGDHIGAVVAEVVDEQAAATVVQRVATRLYVTVPGEARRALEVIDVRTELDSTWFPRRALVVVEVANRGDIRLHPEVRVGDEVARGPDTLLSQSSEQYVIDLPVSRVGGLLRVPVAATDQSGLIRRVNVSATVVPWGYLLSALLVLVTAGLVVRWWRRHESRSARLEADIRRLERLIIGARAEGPAKVVRSGADLRTDVSDEQSLHTGLKRARRNRDHEGFARMALRAHEMRGDALSELLEALQWGTELEDGLLGAAASYGEEAVALHQRTAQLPDDLRVPLLAAARGSTPEA
ncbi:MAG TPA: hypothetical protein VGA69_01235 [Nitriliruptorales bacterium]